MTTIAPISPNIPPPPAQAGLTPRESREQQLRVDQIVRATVSEGGQERVWLNIGSQRYLAETEIPLKTGVSLALLVSKTAPRLEFRVISDEMGGRIRQYLHLLEGPWSLAKLVSPLAEATKSSPESLEAWRQLLALQGDVAEGRGADGLARYLARLGLDYETRLGQGEGSALAATLKKVLEEARKSGPGTEGRDGTAIEEFAGLFELWQLVRAKLAQQAVEFWPLPLPQVEQGFLLAERLEDSGAEGEGADEPSWRLTLHLQLPGLGPLQIDFLWERARLFLRFHCASPVQAARLAERQDELRRSVSAIPLEGVAFGVGAREPATVLARRLAGDGVLDERV